MPLTFRDVLLRQTRIPPTPEQFRHTLSGTAVTSLVSEYVVPDNRDLHIQRLLAHAHATGGETVTSLQVSIRKPDHPLDSIIVIGLEELATPQNHSIISIPDGLHIPRRYIVRMAATFSAAVQAKDAELNIFGWLYQSTDRML